MTTFEVTQNVPDETVPLRTIDPGDAFAYNGALYLRLKYDPGTIVEIGRGSAVANFEGSNPPACISIAMKRWRARQDGVLEA